MSGHSTLSKVLALVFLLSPTTIAFGQQSGTATSCESPELKAFDFQIGVWQEVNGRSVHEVKKILSGCAVQEYWTGGEMSNATALKSYDKGTQRWYMSWISSALIHQLWEAAKNPDSGVFIENGCWKAKPIMSRTYWAAMANDRVERTVEQSRDHGKTWTLHVRVSYERKK